MKINNADKWFSRFIRLKYSQESNGTLFVKCCTCGAIRHPKNVDCGHYIKRQHKSTRYSELNCLPQCKPCNNFEQGNPEQMAISIDNKFGKGTSEKLNQLKNQVTKQDEGLIALFYKESVINLLEKNGWKNLKWW